MLARIFTSTGPFTETKITVSGFWKVNYQMSLEDETSGIEREGYHDYVFAFHDGTETGPRTFSGCQASGASPLTRTVR